MKSFHEPIEVRVGDDGLPVTWRWRRTVWRVLRVLDRWVLQSRWWTDPSGREKRDYLLVEAAPDRTSGRSEHSGRPEQAGRSEQAATGSCAVEIYLKGDSNVWILARILH